MLAFGMPLCGLASTVPTPAPGTGTPVTIPAPNPLQYSATAGSVISSSEFNSNLWKSYNDMNAIAGSLNSCSYASGMNMASVVATSPLVASVGSCVPGVGTQLTLSLAGGIPPAWTGSGAAAGHNIRIASSTNTVGPSGNTGVICNVMDLSDITAGLISFCIDTSGNLGGFNDIVSGHNLVSKNDVTAVNNLVFGGVLNGGTCYGASGDCHITGTLFSTGINANGPVQASDVVASGLLQGANATIAGTLQSAFTNITNTMQAFNATVTNLLQVNNVQITGAPQQIVGGTPFQIPFIAQATSGTGHLEHQIITISTATNPSCTSKTFNVSYTVRPATFYTPRTDPGQMIMVYDNVSTNGQWNVCIRVTTPIASSVDLNAFAIGE